jgi:hypothetical protein
MNIINKLKKFLLLALCMICFGCDTKANDKNSIHSSNLTVAMDNTSITFDGDFIDTPVGKTTNNKSIIVLFNNNSSSTLYNFKPDSFSNTNFSWDDNYQPSAGTRCELNSLLTEGQSCSLKLLYNTDKIEQGTLSIGASFTLTKTDTNRIAFQSSKPISYNTTDKNAQISIISSIGVDSFVLGGKKYSESVEVTLTNNSSLVGIKDITITGLPDTFSIENNKCNKTITSQGSCKFDLVYNPKKIEYATLSGNTTNKSFNLVVNGVTDDNKAVSARLDNINYSNIVNDISTLFTSDAHDIQINKGEAKNYDIKYQNNSNIMLYNITPVVQLYTQFVSSDNGFSDSITKVENNCSGNLGANQKCTLNFTYKAPSSPLDKFNYQLATYVTVTYIENKEVKTIVIPKKIIIGFNSQI